MQGRDSGLEAAPKGQPYIFIDGCPYLVTASTFSYMVALGW